MKQAVYDWMKNLAFFYILLTTVLHLVPDRQYERYVRFFMGLVLILMLAAPAFAILGKSQEAAEDFQDFYQQEESLRISQDMENLQEVYLEKGYEEAFGKKILENLLENGIDALKAEVHIEGEQMEVTVWMKELPDEEQERRIADELGKEWGVSQGNIQILAAEDGQYTMGDPSSSGTASGSDSPSGAG